jgi:hypothetical protein
VFSLLVGARRRSAVRCGAKRSGATKRPKVFEEQPEIQACACYSWWLALRQWVALHLLPRPVLIFVYLAFVPILILSFDLVGPPAAHAPCVGSHLKSYLRSTCTVVVLSLLVGARQRSAVRCGAERSRATTRPKVFEEQPELEALPLLMKCEKAPPLQPLHSWPFTTECT